MLTHDWRAASDCSGGSCVEVRLIDNEGMTMLSTDWQTSPRSGPAGHCVEVRKTDAGDVEVRHSLNPDAGTLTYTPAEWDAFIGGVNDGEFDLPA